MKAMAAADDTPEISLFPSRLDTMRERQQDLQFYKHGVDWTNRLIAGESCHHELTVAERGHGWKSPDGLLFYFHNEGALVCREYFLPVSPQGVVLVALGVGLEGQKIPFKVNNGLCLLHHLALGDPKSSLSHPPAKSLIFMP